MKLPIAVVILQSCEAALEALDSGAASSASRCQSNSPHPSSGSLFASRVQAAASSGGQGAATCPSRFGPGRAAQRAQGRPARRWLLPSNHRNRPSRCGEAFSAADALGNRRPAVAVASQSMKPVDAVEVRGALRGYGFEFELLPGRSEELARSLRKSPFGLLSQ